MLLAEEKQLDERDGVESEAGGAEVDVAARARLDAARESGRR